MPSTSGKVIYDEPVGDADPPTDFYHHLKHDHNHVASFLALALSWRVAQSDALKVAEKLGQAQDFVVQVLVLVFHFALMAFVEKGQQPHSHKHGFEDAVVYASYWKQSRKEEISQGVYSRITILDEPVDTGL